MTGILFVCTANLYRSPLAAASFAQCLARDGQSQHWKVESAGTWTFPGLCVPAGFAQVARGMQIDLEAHRTQAVSAELLARSDLIVVMERGHREALFVEFPACREQIYLLSSLAGKIEYNVPDPVNSEMTLEEIAQEVCRLVALAYPRICQLAPALRDRPRLTTSL
jgi:protein-tyrosine phosphatase